MKKSTKFIHSSRPKIGTGTGVNPPITRASTLVFDRASDLYTSKNRSYGRHGTSVHDLLKEAFCELEGGAGCSLTPSGLAANTLAVQAFVKAGDHVLVTDSTYGPVRNFCDNHLSKFDIEIEYYEPRIGAGIEKLIRPNTSCILLESPGSLTLEVQDIPAIVDVARKSNIITIVDNTWSAGLVYNPLSLGADISVHAATKYFGGHSDTMFGAVVSRTSELAEVVRKTTVALGNASSPDDTYQILRGFRTVVTRFNQQAETATKLSKWLETRDEVQTVINPALSSSPDHDLWKRDFRGGASLFSFTLRPCSRKQIDNFVDNLKLFASGFSYGGFESLAIHCNPQLRRNHPPSLDGPLVRFACGLEAVEDLQADIEQALEKIEFDD